MISVLFKPTFVSVVVLFVFGWVLFSLLRIILTSVLFNPIFVSVIVLFVLVSFSFDKRLTPSGDVLPIVSFLFVTASSAKIRALFNIHWKIKFS